MASWYEEPSDRPGPDPKFWRGVFFAVAVEAVLFLLVYAAVMLPHWAGWLQ